VTTDHVGTHRAHSLYQGAPEIVRVGQLTIRESQVLDARQADKRRGRFQFGGPHSGQLTRLDGGVGRPLAAIVHTMRCTALPALLQRARVPPQATSASSDARRRPERCRRLLHHFRFAPWSWSTTQPHAGSRPPPRSPCRRWRSGVGHIVEALERSRTATPTCWLVGSVVSARKASSTAWASSSICSGVTGRFLVAERTPSTTLARSNGSRKPLRLTTHSGTSSTRSKVVNRRSQPRHSRRRRIAPPSSPGVNPPRGHHRHRTRDTAHRRR